MMTYNEFMNMFKEFKRYKLIEKFDEFPKRYQAAEYYGIPTAAVSRVYTEKSFSINDTKVIEILGYDIRDIDIKEIKELKKEHLQLEIEKMQKEIERLSS